MGGESSRRSDAGGQPPRVPARRGRDGQAARLAANPDRDAHHCAIIHANLHAVRDGHPDKHAERDANANAHPNPHAERACNGNADENANLHDDADEHGYPDADADAHANPHVQRDRDANANAHPNPHAKRDRDSNADRNAHSDTIKATYSHRNTYRLATIHPQLSLRRPGGGGLDRERHETARKTRKDPQDLRGLFGCSP